MSDKLHDILGMSDRTMAEYFVALAKKSSSAEALVDQIKDTGTIDVDANVISFARELFQRVRPNIFCCTHKCIGISPIPSTMPSA